MAGHQIPHNCFYFVRDCRGIHQLLPRYRGGRPLKRKRQRSPTSGSGYRFSMTADFRTFERRLDRTSLILTLIASLCAFLLYSARAALSLALGGVLSAINFHWLKQAVDYVILQGGTGPLGMRFKLQYAGRYALIAITLYVTIHF